MTAQRYASMSSFVRVLFWPFCHPSCCLSFCLTSSCLFLSAIFIIYVILPVAVCRSDPLIVHFDLGHQQPCLWLSLCSPNTCHITCQAHERFSDSSTSPEDHITTPGTSDIFLLSSSHLSATTERTTKTASFLLLENSKTSFLSHLVAIIINLTAHFPRAGDSFRE